MSQRYFEAVSHAAVYAKFRPVPPKQLGGKTMDYLMEKYTGPLNIALDVGCGNGQISTLFSDHFKRVLATDISEAQIITAQGVNHPTNIDFQVFPAEKMPVESGAVQIVSASQACHWFDLPAFFAEVDRVLCPNGVLVLSGYTFPKFSHPTKAEHLFKAMDTFYRVRTGPYWGSGREHVDNEYSNIKIPYKDSIRVDLWTDDDRFTLSELTGYLMTWSGYQNFCKTKGNLAGQDIIQEFIDSCLQALETNNKPDDVIITLRRKYFMLLGRKVSEN